MQTCWPDHHQHPWFITPTLKRKLSSSEPEADGEQQRRKRLHKLECGFAELTLQPPNLPHPTPVPEPQDIKMSSGSWYEPEKDSKYAGWPFMFDTNMSSGIVVTHLDDSDDEQPDESNAQFTISPSLLSALNKKLGIGSDIPPPNPSSQALILFQPKPPSPKRVDNEDSDAMDVELF